MKISIALGLFFIFCSLQIHSQVPFEIKGKVYDKNTHKPVKGALVWVSGKNNHAYTDSTGTFSLKVNFGDKMIAGNLIYKKDSMPVREFEIRKKRPFIFMLEPKIFTLNEVEVLEKKFEPYYDPVWKTPFNEVYNGLFNTNDTKFGVGVTLNLSYLYQLWSRKHKLQRKLYRLIEQDRVRWDTHARIDKSLILNATGLDEDCVDDFIEYAAFSKEFIKHSTDYELVMAIKEKSETFVCDKKNDD